MNGGGHEDRALTTLCSGHHRAHHQGRLAIEGRAPDALRFEWITRPVDDAHDDRNAHVGSNERHPRFGTVVMQTQARDALVGLGWKPAIARGAVDEACARVGTGVPIEQLIAEALRRCPKPLG